MNINKAIAIFEYDEAWRESGFLDEDFCKAQLERWETGQDSSTEHYRYAAFRRILARDSLNDDEFVTYLRLCNKELDTVLYASPLIDLIRWKNLSAQQERYLSERINEFPAPAIKAFRKRFET